MFRSKLMFVISIFTLSVGLLNGQTMLTGDVSSAIFSRYIWRGQRLSSGAVQQSGINIAYADLSAGFWTNRVFDPLETTETDFTLAYGFTIKKLDLTLGYIDYALDELPDTQEFYLAANLQLPLNPDIAAYYDFDEGRGFWLAAGISPEFQFGSLQMSLGASASANFNNRIMGAFDGLYHGEVSLAVKFDLFDGLSAEPVIAYTFPLSDAAKETFGALNEYSAQDGDSNFYGGLQISFAR